MYRVMLVSEKRNDVRERKIAIAYIQVDLVRFRGDLPLRATVAAPFFPFLLKTVYPQFPHEDLS